VFSDIRLFYEGYSGAFRPGSDTGLERLIAKRLGSRCRQLLLPLKKKADPRIEIKESLTECAYDGSFPEVPAMRRPYLTFRFLNVQLGRYGLHDFRSYKRVYSNPRLARRTGRSCRPFNSAWQNIQKLHEAHLKIRQLQIELEELGRRVKPATIEDQNKATAAYRQMLEEQRRFETGSKRQIFTSFILMFVAAIPVVGLVSYSTHQSTQFANNLATQGHNIRNIEDRIRAYRPRSNS
jgi:hypothetical protein